MGRYREKRPVTPMLYANILHDMGQSGLSAGRRSIRDAIWLGHRPPRLRGVRPAAARNPALEPRGIPVARRRDRGMRPSITAPRRSGAGDRPYAAVNSAQRGAAHGHRRSDVRYPRPGVSRERAGERRYAPRSTDRRARTPGPDREHRPRARLRPALRPALGAQRGRYGGPVTVRPDPDPGRAARRTAPV